MTLTDLAKSNVRTIVPAIVGAIVAWALHHGHDVHGYLPQITAVVTAVYYAAARLLEHYVSPRFGWLLGVATAPAYAADPPAPAPVVVRRRHRSTLSAADVLLDDDAPASNEEPAARPVRRSSLRGGPVVTKAPVVAKRTPRKPSKP